MAIDDSLQKQLAERYDKRSQRFSQLLTVTIAFGALFLAFILVPLVGLQKAELQIDGVLHAKAEEIRTLRNEEAKLTEDLKAAEATGESLDKKREALAIQLKEIEARGQTFAGDLEKTNQDLGETAKKLQALEQQHNAFEGMQLTAEGLPKLDVPKFVLELQAFLPAAFNAVNRQWSPETREFEATCKQDNPDDRADCIIKSKVLQMLARHEKVINDEIVVPIQNVDASTANELQELLSGVHREFIDILDERPGFWQEVTLKRHIGQQFEEVLSELSEKTGKAIQAKLQSLDDQQIEIENAAAALRGIKASLESQRAKLQNERSSVAAEAKATGERIAATENDIEQAKSKIANLAEATQQARDEISSLSQQRSAISSEREDISERLKNVESPFGTLPIGLTEALQAFPIILAAGILLAGQLFAELIRIRRGYHGLLRSSFPDEKSKVEQSVTLIAPLIVDPCRSTAANLWRGLVLLVPIVLFFGSIALIIYSWSLDTAPAGLSAMIEMAYIVLYVVFSLLLILPCVSILREWQQYKDSMATEFVQHAA